MNLLLDTHAFLWWITEPHKLSKLARETMEDGENQLYLSAASAMEIATKYALRKLPLPKPSEEYVPHHMRINNVLPLPISIPHALATEHLPWHHRDPFDRLLIAQTLLENLPIISGDPMFMLYQVKVVW